MSYRKLLEMFAPLTEEQEEKLRIYREEQQTKNPEAYEELMSACRKLSDGINSRLAKRIAKWRERNPESTLDDREVLLAIDDENDAWDAAHPEYKDLSIEEQIEYLENLRKAGNE